jgi:hypothetical protein
MDFGSDSILVRIEAPVVVNPDIVSKKASAKDGIASEKYMGSAPMNAADSQLKVTNRKPSRMSIVLLSRFLNIYKINDEMKIVDIIQIINTLKGVSSS